MGKKRPGVKPRENSIQIWFPYRGKRCWETIRERPTEANLDRAARLRAQIINEIKLDVFNYVAHFPESKNIPQEAREKPDFFEVCKSYLDQFQDENTRVGYRNALNRRWSALFPLKFAEITYADIYRCIESTGLNKRTAKYFNNECIPLRGVFDLGVKLGHANESPCRMLTFKKKERPEPDPFTSDEVERIITHAYRHHGEIFGCYLDVGFFTGLRSPSEMIALQWSQLNLKKGLAIINRRKTIGQEKTGTKTVGSRDVKLQDRPLAALRKLRKYDDTYVFINERTGAPFWDGSALNDAWRLTLAALGIRHRKMYNMRHTRATQMLEANVNPAVAAEQLGHSIKMFFEVYAKWINSAKTEEELEKVNQSVAKTVAKATGSKPNILI